MKALALLLKIVAGIVVVLAIAITAIIALVDPNDYKPEITQAIEESTGRELSIGNMSLSVFPHLSIDLEQASLSNAAGFSDQPFVEIEKISVGAAVLPLLSKQLQVEALTLYGLQLNLEKDAQGKTNWDDLVAQNASDKTTETETAENSANPLEKLSSLNFGGIDIQNGRVLWNDQQTQQSIKLDNLNLVTGAITFGEFFPIELQAKASLSQPDLQSQLKLNLEAKLAQDGTYQLQNLALENALNGQGIPVEKAITKISLASFNLQAEQLLIPSVLINYQVTGGADFPLQAINGELALKQISGNLKQQSFAIENIKLDGEVKGETIPSGAAKLALTTSANIDLSQQTAALPALQIQALDMNIKAQINATQVLDNPQASVQLEIAQTNLKNLLNQLQITLPKMQSDKVLQTFAASTNVQFAQKTQSITVNNLKVKLDESNLAGTLSVENFSKPKVRYNLALDKINISQYLPPKSQAPAQPETPQQSPDEKIELPKQMLRDLDIKGTLKVGSLTYDNLQPKNILVTTSAIKGDINLNPIRADLFNTRINAQAGLNVTQEKPNYKFATNTKNLPIGEVMKAFTGDDTVSGTGLVNLNVTTSGERLSEFKQGLNGKVQANLTDGAIKGFNLAQAIRQAKAKISGKTAAKSDTEEKTDFSELNLNANIKNGVVTTNTLAAKAPFMRINGSGTVNLPKESLDYLVKAKIVASDKGQGGEELKDLNGLTIPVKLKGDYTSPDISLDLQSLLEQKTKAEIEKKKEKVVEDVKKKAEEKLKGLIPGFKF